MMGAPSNDHPRCFWRTDVDEAAAPLVEIIREVRPQVLVTYDEHGHYGHPDHIQAHRVSLRARDLAADPGYGEGEPWRIAKFYATAAPRTVLARSIALMRESRHPFERVSGIDQLGYGVPDDQVTTVVDARAHLPAKLAALRAHRTQIAVASEDQGPFFALSNNIGQQAFGAEYYTLLDGQRGPSAADGRESGLFSGLPGLE
jgi:N-acetyl-1-D-myo-inositol-2-amino-2-deoxy-alpha-D-glucopyranoside deacetylase